MRQQDLRDLSSDVLKDMLEVGRLLTAWSSVDKIKRELKRREEAQ